MKLKYIATVAFAVAMASCNILDKEPSDSWDSGSAIQTIDDLKYAVNGVYESQTSSIDKGKNPFGSYAGDFGLFGDLKGSDYKCVGYNNQATDISQYKATATSSMPENIYKRFYLSIARINKIFKFRKYSNNVIKKAKEFDNSMIITILMSPNKRYSTL